MFSLTRSSTWSWPQTSANRVLMSSGIVHVHAAPGQEPEQRAELDHHEEHAEHELQHERQRVPQQFRGGQQGEDRVVWITLPMTTATTAIQKHPVGSRRSRNLVQSDSLRWVSRSNPPNTRCVQNRW